MTAGADVAHLDRKAQAIRLTALRIAANRGQGYVGQALGCAEILSCLFFGDIFQGPVGGNRDRFVLSPGHYALGVYATFAELGLYTLDELQTYGADGSRIEESPLEGIPGFEVTGGSLGQGLSHAVGIALGKRLQGQPGRVFCLVSDGELQEGQMWEAILAASHWRLPNLTVILDRNGCQVDGPTEQVTTLEPVGEKFAAFGFEVLDIDGNDALSVYDALRRATEIQTGPAVVLCNTVLGRGVRAFERAEYPHYVRAEVTVWQEALAELAATERAST